MFYDDSKIPGLLDEDDPNLTFIQKKRRQAHNQRLRLEYQRKHETPEQRNERLDLANEINNMNGSKGGEGVTTSKPKPNATPVKNQPKTNIVPTEQESILIDAEVEKYLDNNNLDENKLSEKQLQQIRDKVAPNVFRLTRKTPEQKEASDKLGKDLKQVGGSKGDSSSKERKEVSRRTVNDGTNNYTVIKYDDGTKEQISPDVKRTRTVSGSKGDSSSNERKEVLRSEYDDGTNKFTIIKYSDGTKEQISPDVKHTRTVSGPEPESQSEKDFYSGIQDESDSQVNTNDSNYYEKIAKMYSNISPVGLNEIDKKSNTQTLDPNVLTNEESSLIDMEVEKYLFDNDIDENDLSEKQLQQIRDKVAPNVFRLTRQTREQKEGLAKIGNELEQVGGSKGDLAINQRKEVSRSTVNDGTNNYTVIKYDDGTKELVSPDVKRTRTVSGSKGDSSSNERKEVSRSTVNDGTNNYTVIKYSDGTKEQISPDVKHTRTVSGPEPDYKPTQNDSPLFPNINRPQAKIEKQTASQDAIKNSTGLKIVNIPHEGKERERKLKDISVPQEENYQSPILSAAQSSITPPPKPTLKSNKEKYEVDRQTFNDGMNDITIVTYSDGTKERLSAVSNPTPSFQTKKKPRKPIDKTTEFDKNYDKIFNKVKEFGGSIKDKLGTHFESYKENFKGGIEEVKEFGGSIKDKLGTFKENMGKSLPIVSDTPIFAGIGSKIVGGAQKLYSGVKNLLGISDEMPVSETDKQSEGEDFNLKNIEEQLKKDGLDTSGGIELVKTDYGVANEVQITSKEGVSSKIRLEKPVVYDKNAKTQEWMTDENLASEEEMQKMGSVERDEQKSMNRLDFALNETMRIISPELKKQGIDLSNVIGFNTSEPNVISSVTMDDGTQINLEEPIDTNKFTSDQKQSTLLGSSSLNANSIIDAKKAQEQGRQNYQEQSDIKLDQNKSKLDVSTIEDQPKPDVAPINDQPKLDVSTPNQRKRKEVSRSTVNDGTNEYTVIKYDDGTKEQISPDVKHTRTVSGDSEYEAMAERMGYDPEIKGLLDEQEEGLTNTQIKYRKTKNWNLKLMHERKNETAEDREARQKTTKEIQEMEGSKGGDGASNRLPNQTESSFEQISIGINRDEGLPPLREMPEKQQEMQQGIESETKFDEQKYDLKTTSPIIEKIDRSDEKSQSERIITTLTLHEILKEINAKSQPNVNSNFSNVNVNQMQNVTNDRGYVRNPPSDIRRRRRRA